MAPPIAASASTPAGTRAHRTPQGGGWFGVAAQRRSAGTSGGGEPADARQADLGSRRPARSTPLAFSGSPGEIAEPVSLEPGFPRDPREGRGFDSGYGTWEPNRRFPVRRLAVDVHRARQNATARSGDCPESLRGPRVGAAPLHACLGVVRPGPAGAGCAPPEPQAPVAAPSRRRLGPGGGPGAVGRRPDRLGAAFRPGARRGDRRRRSGRRRGGEACGTGTAASRAARADCRGRTRRAAGARGRPRRPGVGGLRRGRRSLRASRARRWRGPRRDAEARAATTGGALHTPRERSGASGGDAYVERKRSRTDRPAASGRACAPDPGPRALHANRSGRLQGARISTRSAPSARSGWVRARVARSSSSWRAGSCSTRPATLSSKPTCWSGASSSTTARA